MNAFSGCVDATFCVKSILSLKSPKNAQKYLTRLHNIIAFPEISADDIKMRRWDKYPSVKGIHIVKPIRRKDLSNSVFMKKIANKLSFDISRFTEFLAGYGNAEEDIKPIMLHYAMIYLFDFFSRSWLKFGQNRRHGLKIIPPSEGSSIDEYTLEIWKNGIFQRAVDAFYFGYQSSLFSLDGSFGIDYHKLFFDSKTEKIEKWEYSKTPKIKLGRLFRIYDRIDFRTPAYSSKKSNPILIGYVLLFSLSSISRYRAEDWWKIREDKNLNTKLELLQYDFIYEWIPEILRQTVLRQRA